jgi:hypothetical protein
VTELAADILDARLAEIRAGVVQTRSMRSPEASFARFVLPSELGPDPVGDSMDVDSLRRGWAPSLATVGYTLDEQGTSVRSAWAEGFARLARTDPFPADRVSFAYRSIELIGLALGVRAACDPSRQAILRRVVERRLEEVRIYSWPDALYLVAAKILGLHVPIEREPGSGLPLVVFWQWWNEWQGLDVADSMTRANDEYILTELVTRGSLSLDPPLAALTLRATNEAMRRRVSSPPPPTGGAAKKWRILLICACPADMPEMRLDAEQKIIRETTENFRDHLQLEIRPAATVHDLRRALLHGVYEIVHISAHGDVQGLFLENQMGNSSLVTGDALMRLFRKYTRPGGSLECVLLNACWAEDVGKTISSAVPTTIAMKEVLSDDAAREFARGFYDALGAGKIIEEAYEEGIVCVNLAVPYAEFAPKIFPRSPANVES